MNHENGIGSCVVWQAALFMWHSLRQKGMDGIQAEVRQCLDTAGYLRDQLTAHDITCRLNDLSSTVVRRDPLYPQHAHIQRSLESRPHWIICIFTQCPMTVTGALQSSISLCVFICS